MRSWRRFRREQELLLPPSLREWLPEDHLAWFVIDALAAMDLVAFVAAYRADGSARPAHHRVMMVALLLYAYRSGSGRRGGSSGAAWRTSPRA
jgi:transposase